MSFTAYFGNGRSAGPFWTFPLRSKTLPWQGHTSRSGVTATVHPRWGHASPIA